MIAKIMKLSGNDDQNTQLTNGNRKRKREEQTESFPESEHNITKGADLTLEDLLGAVDKDVNLGYVLFLSCYVCVFEFFWMCLFFFLILFFNNV